MAPPRAPACRALASRSTWQVLDQCESWLRSGQRPLQALSDTPVRPTHADLKLKTRTDVQH